jgi:hypothetical protein
MLVVPAQAGWLQFINPDSSHDALFSDNGVFKTVQSRYIPCWTSDETSGLVMP